MRCSAVVKYLRIVGSIYNRPWIKKKCRHYSCTEYGDEEYNLEAEMPCLEGKPQKETGWPLDLAGSCRTWLIELINHRSNMKWFLIIVLDKSSCSMLNHINLVNITFSFNEGFHAELVYFNCKRTPPSYPHCPLWQQIKHGRWDKRSRAYNDSSPWWDACTAGYPIR